MSSLKVTPIDAVEHARSLGCEVCDDDALVWVTGSIQLAAILNAHAARVLEEAAKACEAEHLENHGQPDQPTEDRCYGYAVKHCAAAVRRMAEEIKP